ncbi:unnamed protein product [Phytomonas sp. EM1]|nr:unnamed protein product [Phytomonas sp. EM1]|eukprot:CCW60231.1 unnamed protein product [Phytomonas sp. isolate EM1]
MFVVTLYALLLGIKFIAVAIIVANTGLLIGFSLFITYFGRCQSIDAETNFKTCLDSLQNPLVNFLFGKSRNFNHVHFMQVYENDEKSWKTSPRLCCFDEVEDVSNHSPSPYMKSPIESEISTSQLSSYGVCADSKKAKTTIYDDDWSAKESGKHDDLDTLYHWSSTVNCWSENNNFINEPRPYLLAFDNITYMPVYCRPEDDHENLEAGAHGSAEHPLATFPQYTKRDKIESTDAEKEITEEEEAPRKVPRDRKWSKKTLTPCWATPA